MVVWCDQGRGQGSAGRTIGVTATKSRGFNLRIDSSTIGMASARSFTSQETKYLRFSITNASSNALNNQLLGGQNMEEGMDDPSGANHNGGSVMAATDKYEELRARINGVASRISGTGRINGLGEDIAQLRDIRQKCIDFLYQTLFGRDQHHRNTASEVDTGNKPAESSAKNWSGGVRVVEYQQVYSYTETETTAFSTTGTVKCADGREIDFNLDLQMSRSFQEYYEENYMQLEVNVCDPLVINLEGNIAGLSDQTILFDIDSDGVKDEVNRLEQGSGYLALDKNADGSINDGSELFGTASGNGFADLAKYDEDGDGWIDEDDDIWNKLKIWVMDEKGEGQLYGLADKGVGAICLGSQSTDFTITNDSNVAKGYIRQSGMFLYESGAVGSVQQVDLVKYDHAG
jgi:hypothetical protein